MAKYVPRRDRPPVAPRANTANAAQADTGGLKYLTRHIPRNAEQPIANETVEAANPLAKVDPVTAAEDLPAKLQRESGKLRVTMPFMHSNGMSTERNVAMECMRVLGLDAGGDWRTRDKLINSLKRWIDRERSVYLEMLNAADDVTDDVSDSAAMERLWAAVAALREKEALKPG